MTGLAILRHLTIGAVCAAAFAASAPAEDDKDDTSRAVRILDQPAAVVAPPVALPPVTPLPAAPVPLPDAGSPPPPAAALSPGLSTPIPQPSVNVPPPIPYDPARILPKAENSAALSLDILPGGTLDIGTKVLFRVAAKKPGYLVLVDIDPTGKLTQIFPNRGSLLRVGSQENLNRIRPGRVMSIPEAGNAYAGFEFVVAPPSGTAMVVAILSDRPVQMLDLPDVPPQLVGRDAAVNYISDAARSLRIADADGPSLREATWSFHARTYAVR